MNKCILLVRVSTQHQNFDEQMREMYALAKKEGYTDANIIAIAHKESARKLKEEERLGLTEMKERIENDPTINCVFAWEISRIARTKKVLFSIEDFLIKHDIQLIIKEPSLRLLTANGEIDRGAEMIFTIYAQLAETESDLKIARAKRTLQNYVKEGKYTGGRYGAKFGYKVDENNTIVINEEEAKIVRHIYQMYIDNPAWGVRQLRLHLRDEGYEFTHSFLNAMLYDVAYTGKKWMRTAQQFRPYPPIISEEQFEQVRQSARSKCAKGDKSQSYTFLSTKLIICPSCGQLYTTFTSSTAKYYRCVRRNIAYKDTDKYCSESPRVNAIAVDSACYNATLDVMMSLSVEQMQNRKNEAETQINELTATNTRLSKMVTKINKALEEGKKLVFDGVMTAQEYKNYSADKKAELDKINKNIAHNNEQIERLSTIMSTKIITAREVIEEYNNIIKQSDKQRIYDDIHRAIKSVNISDKQQYIYHDKTYNNCTKIIVNNIFDEQIEYIYFFSTVDRKQHLIRLNYNAYNIDVKSEFLKVEKNTEIDILKL